MRIPETQQEMKEALDNTLEKGSGIIKGYFMGMGTTTSKLKHHTIKETETGNGIGNVELQLQYRESVINEDGRYIDIERVQNLVVMTPKGDPLWYRKMIVDVWEGEYPSGVAYDSETGDVYFIYLKMSVFIMKWFTRLTEKEQDAVEYDLNQQEPYKIRLEAESMFKVLAGVEGTKYLRTKMYLELDTGVILKIPQRGVC